MKSELFTELFRPKSLDQVIVPERVLDELQHGLQTNILFTGEPGTGKTTLSRILTQDQDTLLINGSEETGIDIIREKIVRFCGTYSAWGTNAIKVVYIEECDGLSLDAWKALRAVIEKHAKDVRFVMNGNYIEKIPEAILSRFNVIHINAVNKEEEDFIIDKYKERVGNLLTTLKISYTQEVLDKFILTNYPDLRRIYNIIQSLHIRNVTELNESDILGDFDYEDVYKLICIGNDPLENYKQIIGLYSNKADNVILAIGKSFVSYFAKVFPNKVNLIPLIVIIIGEHQKDLTNQPDKVVVLLSLIFKLQQFIQQN